jgi:hypothetical protein
MTESSQAFPLPPTAGLLCSVAVSTWIDSTIAGHVAFLLIGRPPVPDPHTTPDTTELQMRGLAKGLGLAPPHALLPDLGTRLFPYESESTSVVITIDDCEHLMRVPIGGQWFRFVADGGPVVIALGFDRLKPDANREEVETFLADSAITGRLLLGKTHAKQPAPETPPDRRNPAHLTKGGHR